jgi:hypothetical protein
LDCGSILILVVILKTRVEGVERLKHVLLTLNRGLDCVDRYSTYLYGCPPTSYHLSWRVVAALRRVRKYGL